MALKIGIIQYFGHSFNLTRDVGMLWDISRFRYFVIDEYSFLESSYLYYLINIVNNDDFRYCPVLPVDWVIFEDTDKGPANIREFDETEDTDIFHIMLQDDFWTTWLPDFPKEDKDDCLKAEMFRWIYSLSDNIAGRYKEKYGDDKNLNLLKDKAKFCSEYLDRAFSPYSDEDIKHYKIKPVSEY